MSDEGSSNSDADLSQEQAKLDMQEFNEEFNSKLRPKLEALEQVRGDLNKEGISVPGIVVCGAQSAGKSSVMEYISDLNFPRAENTCTRCPTIVSLASDPKISQPYAMIGLDAKPEKQDRIDDLSTFGERIEQLTDELTSKVGKGSGVITKEPIYVTVVRPDGPTLTLIDIPGITHMCTDGVQGDIHEVTKNMVESYIKDSNMVILVVIPATDDFGNAEALKIAKEYDPQGTRTLGVVTKCDLIKADSDIVQRIKMEGKNIHLELGFVALRCRTPGEVKSGITRANAMAAESELFTTHPLLSHLASAQWGLLTLVRQIVHVQADCVEAFIPEIKQLLSKRLTEAQSECNRLAPPCVDDATRNSRMNEMIRCINLDLHDIMSGARHFPNEKLHLPAKWIELSESFGRTIRDETPDYLSDEFMEKLKVCLKEVQGVSPPNFMSNPIFRKSLVEVFFAKATSTNIIDGILLDAAKQLVYQMKEAMQDALEDKTDEYICDFPKLNHFVKERFADLLSTRSHAVMAHFEALLKAELSKPYTFNHYYMDTVNKVRSAIMARTHEVAGIYEPVKVGDRVMITPEFAKRHNTLTLTESHKQVTMQSRGTVVQGHDSELQRVHVKWDGISEMMVVHNGYQGHFCLRCAGAKDGPIDGVTQEFIDNAAQAFAHGQSNYDQSVKDMQISLFSYSKVMLKCVLDDVPKLVWSELMHNVNLELSKFVKESLSDRDVLATLMAEDHVKVSKRKRLELTVTRFKDSLKVLRSIK